MIRNNHNDNAIYIPIVISYIFAFSFMVIPVSNSLKWLRPDLVTLVTIYWVSNFPMHIGIGSAFLIGILFDLLTGMLLGSMGLTLSIVAFLAMNLRLRLRIYRFWQKFSVIMLLVALSQLIRLWIQMLVGHPPATALYWLASFTSALAWPIVYSVLNSPKRS